MRVQASGEEGTAATRLLRFPWSTADPSRLSRGGRRVSGLAEMRERRRERRGAQRGKLRGGGSRNRDGDRLPLRKANPKWRRERRRQSGGGGGSSGGREGAKGASRPPTSHSSLLGFSPSVLPLPPTRAAERARPPARAGVELGSPLAARTNHRLRPPRAPASPCALAQGRLRARPPAPSRPLSGRLRRGPSRVPPAARAPASSSSSFLPLPRPHRHQPPPRPPPPPPPAPPRSLHPSRVRLPQSPRGPVPFRRLRERGREGRAGRAVPTGAARVAGGHR